MDSFIVRFNEIKFDDKVMLRFDRADTKIHTADERKNEANIMHNDFDRVANIRWMLYFLFFSLVLLDKPCACTLSTILNAK